jgi:hypothetical protein
MAISGSRAHRPARRSRGGIEPLLLERSNRRAKTGYDKKLGCAGIFAVLFRVVVRGWGRCVPAPVL